jgi:hypothetical protein
MGRNRGIVMGLVGALGVAGLALVPAIGAPQPQQIRAAKPSGSLARSGIGSFTPASADPRLAAAMARGGLGASGFRFTPAETNRDRSQVTVAVRARNNRDGDTPRALAAANTPTVAMQPIAYNLGMSVGWKRFALSGDVARIDLAGMPGSRETVDLGVSYTGKRLSGRVQANADRPAENQPRALAEPQSYSIDLGTSYSLTRNLDVTAGVRYRTEEDRARLPQLTDNRRDSQAVYVGTAFRF